MASQSQELSLVVTQQARIKRQSVTRSSGGETKRKQFHDEQEVTKTKNQDDHDHGGAPYYQPY
jgi:hypothetical protein